MFSWKSRHDDSSPAGAQIPRAVAYANPHAVVLGYLFGTVGAAGVIAEIVLRAS